MKLELITPV